MPAQANANAAAAGAHIHCTAGGGVLLKPFQRGFDQQFRFGAGNEHRRRDYEIQPKKFPVSHDVRQGFTRTQLN